MNKHAEQTNEVPELSRSVRIEDLGLQEFTMDIVASHGELEALTERLKIDALNSFTSQVSLKLLPSGDVRLQAAFQANIEQTCVITLQPVVSDISSSFISTYSHISEEDMGHDEEEFTDLDDDIEPPEPIVDGKIDLGEAITEQLALEIDPFPRVKGATFDGYTAGAALPDEEVVHKKNPFAVLSKLKETSETSE